MLSPKNCMNWDLLDSFGFWKLLRKSICITRPDLFGICTFTPLTTYYLTTYYLLFTTYYLLLIPVFIYIYSEMVKWVGSVEKCFLTYIYSSSYKRKYFSKCFMFF